MYIKRRIDITQKIDLLTHALLEAQSKSEFLGLIEFIDQMLMNFCYYNVNVEN